MIGQMGLLWNRLPALTKAGESGLHFKITIVRAARPSRNPS